MVDVQYSIFLSLGSHLLAVSENIGCRSFAVAANKKVQLYQWQSVEGRKVRKIVNYFELMKEVVVTEPPSLLTLVDCGSNGFSLCVGYRNQFDVIDANSGKITKFHEIDAASPKVCEVKNVHGRVASSSSSEA
jgi:hypothetical protein